MSYLAFGRIGLANGGNDRDRERICADITSAGERVGVCMRLDSDIPQPIVREMLERQSAFVGLPQDTSRSVAVRLEPLR